MRSLHATLRVTMSNQEARTMAHTANGALVSAYRVDHTPPPLSDILPSDAKPIRTDELITQIHPCIDDVDIARMEEYALLAALLSCAPDSALLEALSGIRGDSTRLGAAHTALARAAEEADCKLLEREFFELFVGVGRGELLPYGSYYLTGFLNERPLARLRDDLRMLGIVRSEEQNEPEDHAAILCEIMAGLAGGGLAVAPDAQKRLFEKHLAPWIGRFFADLEGLKMASFYRHVATVGRLFIDIETEAFALLSKTSSGGNLEETK
jgi:TorA maturation chaperone TorD